MTVWLIETDDERDVYQTKEAAYHRALQYFADVFNIKEGTVLNEKDQEDYDMAVNELNETYSAENRFWFGCDYPYFIAEEVEVKEKPLKRNPDGTYSYE